MPLQDKPLPEKQQELVRRWIDSGAARGVPVRTVRRDGSRAVRDHDELDWSARSKSCFRRTSSSSPKTLELAPRRRSYCRGADRAAAGGDIAGVSG